MNKDSTTAVTPSTNTTLPSSENQTTWTIDVDTIGAFCSAPPLLPSRDGNFRMTVGDTLLINLPAGSLINQNNVRLVVVNGVGDESVLNGTADCLGNLRFEWLADENSAGPCSFCFDYIPFAPVPSSLKRSQAVLRFRSGSDLVLRRQSSISDEVGYPERQTGVVNRIIVSPRITINGKLFPVESLSMQTVMSRCLGPLDTWLSRLQPPTADLNYNVIHFTPVQVTGESGSCYSLADQLEISPELLPSGSKSTGWDLLRTVINELESRHGIMSTSDVVLNHTANDTHWIPQHPECGYNERNSPHLMGPIELDIALQKFSLEISNGHYRGDGLTEFIENEGALKNLRRLVQQHVLNPFRLGEWFEVDVEGSVNEFRNSHGKSIEKPEGEIRRLLFEECLKTVGVRRRSGVCPNGNVTARLCKNDGYLRHMLRIVQDDLYYRVGEINNTILNAVEGYVRWERVQCRRGAIGKTHWNSLVPRYFTPVETKGGETLHLANNGWVMDWDAEKDFAAPGSLVYFSRSLVAWSDCIKLRYGEGPQDCPFLWDLVKDYCTKTAKIFRGIRLDNCHSTPIHVAKFCLTESRKVNPNLWVYAELFTGKRETDMKFERQLGLNALIREAMQSYNAANLVHHIKELGGRPIGCLDPVASLTRIIKSPRPLCRTLSPSLFFDCTHDNETPQQKRTAIDALPNAAAVASAFCAIGSCRGYDELVPRVLSVVTEKRHFHSYQTEFPDLSDSPPRNGVDFTSQARFCTSLHTGASSIAVKGSWDGWRDPIELIHCHGIWTGHLQPKYFPKSESEFVTYEYKFIANGRDWFFDPSVPHSRDNTNNVNNVLSVGKYPPQQIDQPPFIDARQVTDKSMSLPGIMEARKVLNALHQQLAFEGFSEISVECRLDDILIVIRHDPQTHRMCYFFIYTAFTPAVISHPQEVGTIEIKGKIDEIILEARLIIPENVLFVDESNYINGLSSRCLVTSHSKEIRSKLNFFNYRYDDRNDKSFLTITTSFLPGSVFIVMTAGYPNVRKAVANSIEEISSISQGVPGASKISRFEELQAFSYLLYSCGSEERDRSKGTRGCYELQGIGPLPYAGIAGFVSIFDKIRYTDNLDHPLIKNITSGDWLFDYQSYRLDTDKDDAFSGGVVVVLVKVASWLREISFEPLRYLPRNVISSYLDWIFSSLYSWVAQRLMAGMPEPLRSCKDPFLIRLALATLQFYSYVPSAPLIYGTNHPSLSAGLPHFATQYMRAWGRDTFISFRGCLLATGRYQEAREEILGFARVMRHGLIPNLLDSGNNPRFNARDATWLFLQSIQDYCAVAPDGTDFLKTSVSLKYSESLPPGISIETIADLIHFILSQHAQGIEFREWNAGTKIDSCMRDEGFNIKVTCDKETGFIFGGNQWNCGTWMDKMGSSQKAGNRGFPATPRDGASVEIIGLLKSTLRFVTSLPSNVFEYEIVDPSTGLSYKKWNDLLEKSFDQYFYIGTMEENKSSPAINCNLVNKTEIIRDSLKATESWRDYQLRPNFCITLSVAPELVPKDHALASLENASTILFRSRNATEVQHMINNLKIQLNTEDAVEINNFLNQQYKSDHSILFTTQLGLKTLDPSDYNYHPNYNNDDDSNDFSIAHGFNYHNGPEWVWPVGYFLEALFSYSKGQTTDDSSLRQARFNAMRLLLLHRQHIATDPWISLPELTNDNAGFCSNSCTAQAWSVGTLLAFLETVAKASSISHGKNASSSTRTTASPNETPSDSPKNTESSSTKEQQRNKKGLSRY